MLQNSGKEKHVCFKDTWKIMKNVGKKRNGQEALLVQGGYFSIFNHSARLL